jgi:hypothetical protein
MEKFTKKNVYAAIINFAQTSVEDNDFWFVNDKGEQINIPAENVIDFAKNEIGLLEKKAIKAKENAAKKKAESDALLEAVKDAISDEFEPVADIAARVEGDDVTAAKVVYRLNKLVSEGFAEKADIKIPGTEGAKARVVKGFRRIVD